MKSFNVLPAAIRRRDAADVRYLLKIHSQMFLTAEVCKLPFASRPPPLPAAVLLNFKYLQFSVAPQCSSGLNGGPALCSPAAPHPSQTRGACTGRRGPGTFCPSPALDHHPTGPSSCWWLCAPRSIVITAQFHSSARSHYRAKHLFTRRSRPVSHLPPPPSSPDHQPTSGLS